MDLTNEEAFLERVFSLIKSEGLLKHSSDCRVVNFVDPQELKEQIDLKIGKDPESIDKIEQLCKVFIKHSVKTNNPNFRNQLYGGMDLYGFGGEVLSTALNTNQHTFEVAPVFSLVEREIVHKLLKTIGYESGDGMFCPGGSISNMYGMVLARYHMFPSIKKKGVSGIPSLVAFISEDAHYSLAKAAHWLGIGTDNLVKVKTDLNGKMIIEELEKQILQCINEQRVPFFVCATVGTTVLGAIDPIDSIADLCQRYKIWLHVDACYGGILMLSRSYKEVLKGIDKSDSLCWNPHKMLGAPLQCSIFLTSHDEILQECNSASASYLFQPDKFYDTSYDSGDKSIQCGRKTDCFKLWIMWKVRGDVGFEELIDNALDCARYFKHQIERRDGFRLVQSVFEISNICFWYIPDALRGLEENNDWWTKVARVAPSIKESLIKSGTLMINYAPLPEKGLCNFFRMVVTCHPQLSYKDMDLVINKIENCAKEITFIW